MPSGRSLIVAIIALTLSLGTARLIAQRPGDSLPASVGDLTAAQLVEIRDHGGQVLLHGTLKTSKNEPKETEREADLVSPSGQKAKGHVEIEIERKDGVVAKEEFVVSFEKLPAMIECELFLDGRHVSSFTTPKAGKAEVKLERKGTIER
jgi:hypothetical protein